MASSTDPIFTGSIATGLVIQPGARLGKVATFGFDTLAIPFRVRTSLLASKVPALFSAPPAALPAPGLYFNSYDAVTEEGTISQLTLNYIGCLNGAVPPVYSKNSFSIQTVSSSQASISNPDVSINLTLSYRAPSTTYTWIETQIPPDEPRYVTMLTKADPLKSIITAQSSYSDGQGTTVDSADFTAALNKIINQVVVAQYETEVVVPDKYWKCTAVISRTLT